MSVPIFPEKYKLPALLTAERMIEFRRKHGGLGRLPAPEGVVISLYNGVMKRFAWKYPSRRAPGFLGDVYLLKRARGKTGVLGNFGIGAPALTATAEEMMAWGTKRVILMSLAGGLQPGLEAGSIVVCDRAIRDEGVSYHYLPPAREVEASAPLVQAISRALEKRGLLHSIGATWSTDAPYRETRQEVEYYGGSGVLAVDMESAGVFAVGKVRNVQVASVFVIGDSLAKPAWSPPAEMQPLHQRLETLLDLLIGVAGEGV